jgi:hypothetical protein
VRRLPLLGCALLAAGLGACRPAPVARPVDAGAPAVAVDAARPRLSPTAEGVWIVCSGEAPPGSEDRQMIADRLDRLAAQKSDEARRVLTFCLESEDAPAEARPAAARKLAELGVDRAAIVPMLRKMLRNRDAALRVWHTSILLQLYKLRATEAIPDIADALLITEDEARTLGLAEVVDAAVRILVEFDTPAAWAGIERAATDPRAAVRRPVVQALAALFGNPKARERLLKFLDDPAPDVRTRACTLIVYEPVTRRDRRPDLFRDNPCFESGADWPAVAAKVRHAIATLDAYERAHPPKKPRLPGGRGPVGPAASAP